MTNLDEAKKLASTLYRTGDRNGHLKIRTRIEFEKDWRGEDKIDVKSAKIVFSGGAKGGHEIWLSVSSLERIVAHFEGYCEANGMLTPEVGQIVAFPSASNWRSGGYRTGKVLSVGPKRAVVAYKFKHGGETTKTVPIADLKFSPRFPKLEPTIETRFDRMETI